jgi:UDP-N-acetylmuramoylalanine--D-glutamate ligase
MDEFRDRRVSVIGAARSGIAAAGALTRLGADVLLSDSQPAEALRAEQRAEVAETGARFMAEAGPADALPAGTDLVVTSPGVPKTAAVLREAVRRGIPVWSEIELAYRLTEAPILAVTGTNGKTTTTLLIAAMLRESGRDVVVAGNISADEMKKTLVEAAVEESPSSLLVAEVSSFQLEWVETFAPKVGVLTNVTPDHLNRHACFEEYAQTKARLFAAQKPDDWAIMNYDDPTARAIGESGLRARRAWFTRRPEPPDDGPAAWLKDGCLMPHPGLNVRDMPFTLPGAHSLENVMAASLAATVMGAHLTGMNRAVRHFPGVPHRMEFVAERDGVRYINNSMCTNVAAAVASLSTMDRPTVVIAGGADKELDFAPLAPFLCAKAKHLVLIGAAADKMEATFRARGYDAITRAETLQAAVQKARAIAKPGDAVLLSPACASFDMFRDFEARGEAFRQAVRALKTEKTR